MVKERKKAREERGRTKERAETGGEASALWSKMKKNRDKIAI